jgi:DNA-binding winged helix-turn-helix (wHTH) protein/Flp pilus assembly protein TadD
MPSLTSNSYRFGAFTLDAQNRVLRNGTDAVPLTPKAFDVLLTLIQKPGTVLTKEELIQTVWPDSFVEESNLTQTIFVLRRALGETPEQRYIVTISGKGYRFVPPVVALDGSDQPNAGTEQPVTVAEPAISAVDHKRPRKIWMAALAALAVAATVTGVALHQRSNQRSLTGQDTVVLADFANSTGEPVFDDTLKMALSVELMQSPFLNVSSDSKISEMLRRMGRSSNDPLTPELAREVCLRLGGKAVWTGTISRLGSKYVIGLQALGCASGDILAAGETDAANKENVLNALNRVASKMRGDVGESLASLQKYDFPVDTTTKSLDALKMFSMGFRTLRQSGEGDAIPFFKQAVELDPDFALAYTSLGRAYEDIGEDNQAVENFTKAFQLRDRLSERERYHVSALYDETVSGDMQQAKEVGELWVQTYPLDTVAREKLGTIYGELGNLERASQEFQKALQLDPDSTINVSNSAMVAAAQNRLDEAEQILAAARARGLDGSVIHETIYPLAFLRSDRAEMERQVAWASGPGADYALLSQHSDTEAYWGHLSRARNWSRAAVESAIRGKNKETASFCELAAALREVETGNLSLAKESMQAALSRAPTRNVKLLAALVLGRAGDETRAEALIKELETENPLNTLVNSYWLPTVKASLEVHARKPQAAILLLQQAAPYELGSRSNFSAISNMYPPYVRGQAYLLLRDGKAAAAEFKKLLDHPGVVQNGILGALSRLQLARAEAMAGNTADARTQYGSFLASWKDADAGIPLVEQAKAEFAKLH